MLETNFASAPGRRARRRSAECGVAAVEFALIATLFFTLMFGIIELARIVYMYNTLAEVTRCAARAASNIDFTNSGALDAARREAVMDQATGALPFGAPITYKHLRIDYLSLSRASSGAITLTPVTAMPSCPARNRQNCLADPYGSSCIRLVRVRVCSDASSSQCDRVPYQPMIPFTNLGVQLPSSTTIVRAETLGYKAGDPLCP